MKVRNKKVYFAIPILLILFCFAISLGMTWKIIDDVLEQENQNIARVAASHVHTEIENELDKTMVVAQTIAHNKFIIQLLEDETKHDNAYLEKHFAEYLAPFTTEFGYNIGFIVSNHSKKYFSQKGFHKVMDPENDPYDRWYPTFLEKKSHFDIEIDVDEVQDNVWTLFLNHRIESPKGFLGIAGVGLNMSDLQKKLQELQKEYEVQIHFVDQSGNVKIDVDGIKMNESMLHAVPYDTGHDAFRYTETENGYTATKHLKQLGLFLSVHKEHSKSGVMFIELIRKNVIITSLLLVAILALAVLFIRIGQDRIADAAERDSFISLSSVYESMFTIDFVANTFTVIKRDAEVNRNLDNTITDAKTQLFHIAKQVVEETQLEDVLEFMNPETVPERLAEKTTISMELISKISGWCRARYIAAERQDGKLTKAILAIEHIDEEKKREQRLIKLSETDMLTGIRNRGSGERAITELLSQNKKGIFYLMDADKFKSINDTLGHDVGDKVIQALANGLKNTFRENDVYFRLGGDEFAVFATYTDSQQTGQLLIDRLFEQLNNTHIPEMGERKIMVSVGAVIYDGQSHTNFNDLYTKADLCLYDSKKVQGSFCTFAS